MELIYLLHQLIELGNLLFQYHEDLLHQSWHHYEECGLEHLKRLEQVSSWETESELIEHASVDHVPHVHMCQWKDDQNSLLVNVLKRLHEQFGTVVRSGDHSRLLEQHTLWSACRARCV